MTLLEEALRHSSFVNEQASAGLRDNERLEFLGDAVLNLVIGDLLMRAYPALREGDLSRIRANMVNETQLAEVARASGSGTLPAVGQGRGPDGRSREKFHSGQCRGGRGGRRLPGRRVRSGLRVIERHFGAYIEAAADGMAGQDFKSRLQEAVQGKFREVPRYRVVEEQGPDHDKTFSVVMTVGDLETRGTGKSKKLAEQDAARQALSLVNGQ